MSLTVQCRLLCKTLKAVDIFCIPYLDIEFSGWRQSCPLSSWARVFSLVTEGWLHAVPLGKTISNCEIDLLCQAVVNRFHSSFVVVLKITFESSFSQPTWYPRKQVQRREQFAKIDNSIEFFFFLINLRLLSLKAKTIAVVNRTQLLFQFLEQQGLFKGFNSLSP